MVIAGRRGRGQEATALVFELELGGLQGCQLHSEAGVRYALGGIPPHHSPRPLLIREYMGFCIKPLF